MWRWIRMLSITSGNNIIKNEEFGVITFLPWASIPLVFPIITVATERSILTLSRWLFTRSESSFCQWNLMINSIIWDYLSLTNSFANVHFFWIPPHILQLSQKHVQEGSVPIGGTALVTSLFHEESHMPMQKWWPYEKKRLLTDIFVFWFLLPN